MVVLSDRTIEDLVARGVLGIEPYDPECQTPNGYDLRIGEIYHDGKRIKDGTVRVNGWFAVSTVEYIRMPPDIIGNLWIRTSWARKGVMASFGVVDAGFEGELTLSAFATKPVDIAIGERFAQIVFLKMDGESHLTYERRSGNYQGQRGVRLG